MESIGVSGRHLLEIITDVFDISAIETGRMQLSEEKVSLAEAAEAVPRHRGAGAPVDRHRREPAGDFRR